MVLLSDRIKIHENDDDDDDDETNAPLLFYSLSLVLY